jgi:hypothetical protein
MSIESKHAYRFGYLKSEEWGTVRIEALAREKALCQICGDESIHNDAHHVWYPENIWETTVNHLVILCRACHGFVHDMVPECKTNDEEVGRAHWAKFQNSIKAWRADKCRIFEGGKELGSAPELRRAYVELKEKYENLLVGVLDSRDIPPTPKRVETPVDVFQILRSWEIAYKKSLDEK